jgi:hypothetical protein
MINYLSNLLYNALRRLLSELEILIFKRKRQDWPSTCFSLSLVLLAMKPIQLDILMYNRNSPKRSDRIDFEPAHFQVLREIFHASTSSFNPLILDWNLDENKHLVENEPHCIEAFRQMQALTQEFCM